MGKGTPAVLALQATVVIARLVDFARVDGHTLHRAIGAVEVRRTFALLLAVFAFEALFANAIANLRGLVDAARGSVRARVHVARQDVLTIGTAEPAVATTRGQSQVQHAHTVHIAKAVVRAELAIGERAKRNGRVAFHTARARVNKAQIAHLLACGRIAAVMAAQAAVLLHAAHIARRGEIVGGTFDGHGQRECRPERGRSVHTLDLAELSPFELVAEAVGWRCLPVLIEIDDVRVDELVFPCAHHLHAIGTVVHGEEFQVKARLKVRIKKRKSRIAENSRVNNKRERLTLWFDVHFMLNMNG